MKYNVGQRHKQAELLRAMAPYLPLWEPWLHSGSCVLAVLETAVIESYLQGHRLWSESAFFKNGDGTMYYKFIF